MESIVTTALVGTGQQQFRELASGTPVDALAQQLSDMENERRLLLVAGTWSLYRQTGILAQQVPAVPEAAAEETLRPPSSQVTTLLAQLMQGENKELLPEAFTYLKQAGKRLSFEQLPLALDIGTQRKDVREVTVPVLGERGVWLSRFHPRWSWVAPSLIKTTKTLPEDAEQIWQEGSVEQRKEILHRMRDVDPTRAREWLNAVWKQEKAEERAKFLATFETSLAPADEEMLEKSLDDRSTTVRTTAIHLLARLPGSALTQRIRERVLTLLTYANGKLNVKPPKAFDKTWVRDGISEKAPQGIGARAHWLTQLLALVPPHFWEEQFNLQPKQLVSAVTASEWWKAVLTGWSQATILHRTHAWAGPLWKWWFEIREEYEEMQVPLMSIMPHDELLSRVTHILRQEPAFWPTIPSGIPGPWNQELGSAYIQALRKSIQPITSNMLSYYNSVSSNTLSYYDWNNTLKEVAFQLPYDCFEEALVPWEWPDNTNWQIHSCQSQHASFVEILQLRKRLIEEIM